MAVRATQQVPGGVCISSSLDGRVVADLHSKVRDLEVLQAFSATLLHYKHDIDDILWDVAEQAVARIGLEDCVIYLLDEERGDLVQRAAYGPKNPQSREVVNRIRLRLGEGIVGSCALAAEPVCVGDTRLDERYVQDDAVRLSELAVPIFHGDRVIGVIDSEHREAGFFTHWHVGIFTTLAAMTASRITAARLEQERIALATRDHLTGLVNRPEFMRQLEQRIARGDAAAALLICLDHFGIVNEWIGAEGGDQILRVVSERLGAGLPRGATIARIGGDEFAALLEGDVASAIAATQAILSALAEPLTDGTLDGLRVTASAGVVDLAGVGSSGEAMEFAGQALREARRGGHGRWQVHDARLSALRKRQQRLARELTHDIATNAMGLCAHFQPIVRVRDGVLAGAEVLARWRHSELGDVGPNEFVPVAESSGRIHDLGRHIFRRTLEHVAAWADEADGLVFSVNVSPLQLQRDGFLESILRLLEVHGVASKRIACEVTESTLLADEDRAQRVLGAILERGVKLVLDDFGTGYASLGTLTRYPFSGVKIDRSFIRHIDGDRRSRAVVHSVISMSHDLGLSCTAEGIETAVQLEILRALGCELGQGWLFSAARPAEVFAGLLKDRGALHSA
jgi:diguanylate cyclase (GGDEF)-like protein